MITRSQERTQDRARAARHAAAELAEHTLLASIDVLTSTQVESIQAEAAAMTPAEVEAMLIELGIFPRTELA